MRNRQRGSPGTHKTTRIAPAAIVVSALLLSACGGGGSTAASKPANIKVAFLTKHLDNPWFVNETGGAKQQAGKLGVKLTVQDLQFDANLALTAVDTVIGAGTKGIIIVVPDQKIGPSVISKARTAHIPIMAVDDTIKDQDGKPAPFVGFDAPKLGDQVGNAVADLYLKAGWASDSSKVVRAASIEQQTLSVCQARTDASTAAFLNKVPAFGSQNVLHIAYDGTLNGSLNVMSTVVTAHPNVTNWLFWSCNDDGVLGGIRALENRGVPADRAIGVGLGGNLTCGEFNKPQVTSFAATTYVNSANEGITAMQEMYDAIVNGKAIPQSTLIPATLVTRDNFKQVMNC
jgi:L-arabinose transport system substrate-binding protein